MIAIVLLFTSIAALFLGPIFATKFQNCPNPLFPCQSTLTSDPTFFARAIPLILIIAISIAIIILAATAETMEDALSTETP